MAIVTNTFLTFSAVGNREDLEDAIYMISPTDTPVMTMVGRSKAAATLHEWQTDALASATTENAQLEGDDTSYGAITATTRLSNTLQISRKAVIVSGTQDVVNKAGRKSEFAYQVAKASKELKRDMEAVITGNFTQNPPSASGATTARKMRPLCAWYATNDQRGTSGADGASLTAATDGTQRAFTETLLKAGLKAAWDQGGEPSVCVLGSFNKQVASTFTGNATRMDKSEDSKVNAAVDVYVSDFGEIKFVPDRFSRTRDAHLLDLDYWSVAFLRPFMMEDMAKTGDASKKLILAEYTLVSKNEASSSIVADLTTS